MEIPHKIKIIIKKNYKEKKTKKTTKNKYNNNQ